LALISFEGTVKQHAPGLDFQAAARPFILPALMRSGRAVGDGHLLGRLRSLADD
jgi:hypothetical protein